MGHLRRNELVVAYNRIKRDAVGRTCSILILVTPTVDGLCALKILTELLKCDFIPFKVVPVAGYDDIVAANDNFIQGKNEIRSVIMIDCGATVDLAELLSVSPEMMIYLIDSHRPYSLFNIFSNSQLIILDDGFIEDNLRDLEQAFEATQFEASESESSTEDGGDQNDDETNSNENVEPNYKVPQRDQLLEGKVKHRHQSNCRRKLLEYYRTGTWYGTSVARLVFDISDTLSRHCNDYLWCSILGVTAQQLMELTGQHSYETEVSWLRERCLQLNREIIPSLDSSNEDYSNRDGRIKCEPEFRFMLTRHWTLFNSMLHSRYMATRLAVWREKGKRLLETFIVKMGIPLAQCKLDYSSMELELKESLPARIGKHSAEFGLGELSMPSFVREFGYVTRLSASDAVYALMALIEAPFSAIEYSNLSGVTIMEEEDTLPIWVKNFYYAFEALDYQHIDKLRRGIQLAMRQQQVILHEATTILGHRLLRYGRRFRYVILRHGPDLAWLSNHPLSLNKLTLFLVEATRNSKRGHTPLVLAAYQSPTDTYVVIAITTTGPSQVNNDSRRNRFGLAFRRAAQTVRARVKHDGFDSAMIEVKADDLKGFLQTLQTIPL